MKSFTAFLSHKYDASLVNEYFFRLFSTLADVQFEIDAGKTATNVTRLERMIRDSDGFIGIYPFDSIDTSRPSAESLQKSSQYFRLELDLVARAQKPALIFSDSRYGKVLSVPESISHETFNHKEILSQGAKPSTERFAQISRSFFNRVATARKFHLSERLFEKVSGRVGILVPVTGHSDSYRKEHVDLLRDGIGAAGFEAVVLDWLPVLTPALIGQLRTFDWIIVDVGPEMMSTGIVGYLHGAFIPTMRLLKVHDPAQSEVPATLYGGVDVGYRKDIVRWSDLDTLRSEVTKRLDLIDFGTRRISTLDEAISYFAEATRRKETVFLSYSGEDEVASEPLRAALRRKFQQVFDYRDGASIAPGQTWISQIFDRLGRSAVGIPLLSSNYIKSGNCMHELRQIVALTDGGKMQTFPIKLTRGDEFTLPPEIQSTQYARNWEYKSADELVDWISSHLETAGHPTSRL